MKAIDSEKTNESRGGGKPETLNLKSIDETDWNRFSMQLDEELSQIQVPLCMECKNVHCKEDSHIRRMDDYTKNVLDAVDRSISNVAKKNRSNISKAKVVPGWSEIVSPFADEAKFWSAIWVSAGKPLNTSLHHIMKRTRNRYHYAIRKCKRAAENILKDKMLNACVNGKDNIFDKIRSMRRTKNTAPKSIDGDENPARRFAEVYGNLYNSTNDMDETNEILAEIDSSVNAHSIGDVDLVTPELIGEVAKEIKSNKNDPTFTFNSNCVKKAPPSFYHHVANIIKGFLIHGHVSQILLLATIVPLLKDKLGKLDSSDNYRSIALSSVILKIFDWVVITLFGEKLGLDDLQFSYQKKCSTNMCTWLVIESISHYSRKGSDVFSCFMDMKKAFDMVKHGLLFRKLVERNVPPIFLRLLLAMYVAQRAKVRWDGTVSEAFSVLNGVKQGAVLSAILFCVYINDLIKELRRNRDGCWVNSVYVGIIVYADDIVLLSPSIDGLQNMINTCSRYAKSHNLTFSTHDEPAKSKTKCMAFLRKKRELSKTNLCGKPLPWVDSVKHLGTTITNNLNRLTDQDLLEKRAMYIARNNELSQEFYYAHPKTKIWINNVYNTSFYGAPLWDISSRNFEKLEKTWNVSIRTMLSLPRNTHRYLLEPLAETPHIIKFLWKRFVTFVGSIADGNKTVLRRVLDLVRNDTRSVTGKNLRLLKMKTENFNEKELDVHKKEYKAIPSEEMWRVPLTRDLIATRCGDISSFLSKEQLDNLADHVCGS